MKKLIAVCTILACAAAGALILVHRVHVAERAWAADFGPLESYPRLMNRAANRTAVDLSNAAVPLGLSFSVTDEEAPPVPDSIPQEALDTILQFASKAPFTSSDAIEPPRMLSLYVHARADALDRFCEWVAKNPPPVLGVELADVRQPLPNRLGLFRLQKLIIASALARKAGGDREGAERLLDCSWRLNQEFRRSPALLDQSIACAVFRFELGALRKIDVDPSRWIQRLHEHDYRQSVADSLKSGVYVVDHSVRDNAYADPSFLAAQRALYANLDIKSDFSPRWYVWLRTPIRWFDLPAAIESQRAMLLAARTAQPSEHLGTDLDEAFNRGWEQWTNLPDRDLSRPSYRALFTRLAGIVVETELTEKVLAARAARNSHGAWPAALPGLERSAIRNRHWAYSRAAAGAAVSIEPPIEFQGLVGQPILSRYELR